MKNSIILAVVAMVSSATLQAQTTGTVSPIQSTARPSGLSVVGPVMQGGSDASSSAFQNVLPGMQQFINSYLPEYHNNTASPLAFNIDPSKLTLATQSNVRVYFAYEGAGYHNTIGFNTTGTGTASGNPQIIFPDASSSVGYGGAGTAVRSATEPLVAGDYVNLGTFNAGTLLDFFLIANGANGGSTTFSTSGVGNPDGLNHAATFTPTFWGAANSPYLFISFEDLLGGGDKDFNDVIIAIDIGAANVAALLATPEPAMWLTLGSLLPLGILARRKSQRRAILIPA
ncbi:MAG: DUF4114 domain-containing protein [Verrucomicrobiota bacterium]